LPPTPANKRLTLNDMTPSTQPPKLRLVDEKEELTIE
jgi:hypothetical protein